MGNFLWVVKVTRNITHISDFTHVSYDFPRLTKNPHKLNTYAGLVDIAGRLL